MKYIKFFGNWAFARCSSLASVTIPASVTAFGFGAFEYCSSLANVTIPASVTSIGNMAFADFTYMQTITVQGKASQGAADAAWGADWRSNCNARIVYQGR